MAFFVVLHTSADGPGVLPHVLNRVSAMPAVTAQDGAEILPGRIYVAPPDRHLLLEPGRVRLSRSAQENRHRPAIDPLFRTAAYTYGSRVIGVVLSGYLDDGTAGLMIIKKHGGLAIVQDPDDAMVPGMPSSALNHVEADHVLPACEIGALLSTVVGKSVPVSTTQPAGEEERLMADERIGGKPSVFTCPDCSGTLWEYEEGDLLRFRCRVGHSFSAESMAEDQTASVERALWAASRALEERAELSDRMAARSRRHNHSLASDRYAVRARASREDARMIRDILLNGRFPSGTAPEEVEAEERRTGT